jgi:toxin ParE1/3/4
VNNFRLTPKAVTDLGDIVDYTLREHGERQCSLYLSELEMRFARLREMLVLERPCDRIRPGLKSQKQGHHVVFYLHESEGVLIVRVLHERMAHEEHDFANEGQ